MKNLFTFIFLLVSLVSFAQEGEDHPLPDSSLVVSFPWYDNNQFLLDYLDQRGYYENTWGLGGANVRTDCPIARYKIPTKIHVYRDNAGSAGTNIVETRALNILEQANEDFAQSGIQFYLTEIEFKNNENRRTGISNQFSVIDFFEDEREPGVMNIHMIHSSSFNDVGYAITPYYNKYDIYENIVEDAIWSCYVTTDKDPSRIANTLAHELGHALGLLHTHHPGRIPSMIFNEENATISNGCYQEMQSRSRENKVHQGCLSSGGRLRCEINGDFLCDTAGDPGMGTELSGTTMIKGVNHSGCGYEVDPTFNSDYKRDNDHHDWTPPTTNIMSYADFRCREQFTPMQLGQMWYFIENDFPFEHRSQFSGWGPVCEAGKTFTFTNPPAGISNLTWSVDPPELIDASTRTGTGTTAFIKAADNTNRGFVSIEWMSGSTCNYFNTSTSVWIGAANQAHNQQLYVQGFYGQNPITLAADALYNFEMATVSGANQYSWTLPSGFSFHGNTSTSNFAPLWTPNQNGTYVLRVYPQGLCGNVGTGSQTLTINITDVTGGNDPNCPNPPCQLPSSARIASENTIEDETQNEGLLDIYYLYEKGLVLKGFENGTDVVVMDAMGRYVTEFCYKEDILDVSILSDGVYIVSASDNKSRLRKRILVR